MRLMEGEHVGPFNLGNPGEFTMLELAKVCIYLSHDIKDFFKKKESCYHILGRIRHTWLSRMLYISCVICDYRIRVRFIQYNFPRQPTMKLC